MLIVDYSQSLRCLVSRRYLLLPPLMKSNPARYISPVFLALFACAFSFRNAVAATGSFSRASIEIALYFGSSSHSNPLYLPYAEHPHLMGKSGFRPADPGALL
jgi:hypothetical protein